MTVRLNRVHHGAGPQVDRKFLANSCKEAYVTIHRTAENYTQTHRKNRGENELHRLRALRRELALPLQQLLFFIKQQGARAGIY